MILSTTTDHLFRCYGYEQGVKTAAEVGFDALDLNMCEILDNPEWSEENYEKTAKMLKKYADENGIYFNQAHAPFPSYRYGNDEYNSRIYPMLTRSVKIAGIIGASQIVVHPTAIFTEPEQMKFNIDFYKKLIPCCKEAGVKIAIENMWGWNAELQRIVPNVCSFGRELARYYDELDPELFTVCLDIGHTVLIGQEPDEAIREIGGSRLGALHVHDNDGIHDFHIVPYQGILDWDKITKALSDIKYSGDFTYEVGGEFLNKYADKPELMYKVLELMVLTGRHLIEKIK